MANFSVISGVNNDITFRSELKDLNWTEGYQQLSRFGLKLALNGAYLGNEIVSQQSDNLDL